MRCLIALLMIGAAWAQPSPGPARAVLPVAALPSTCSPSAGSVVALTTGGSKGLYSCTATNTFTYIGSGSGGLTGCSSDGTKVTCTIPLQALQLSSGTGGAPNITGGTGIFMPEAAAPSAGFPAAGLDGCYADSTAHKIKCSFNNDTAAPIARTIASGTSALGTSSINSGACATVVTTTATGTLSTDAISWTPNASIKAVTGYVPSTSGGLSIAGYPTADAVNWDVCNWTSGAVTPGAVTLNWRVVR